MDMLAGRCLWLLEMTSLVATSLEGNNHQVKFSLWDDGGTTIYCTQISHFHLGWLSPFHSTFYFDDSPGVAFFFAEPMTEFQRVSRGSHAMMSMFFQNVTDAFKVSDERQQVVTVSINQQGSSKFPFALQTLAALLLLHCTNAS
jgi:hypothetical protein